MQERSEHLAQMDAAQMTWTSKLSETAKSIKEATRDAHLTDSGAIEIASGDEEDEDEMEDAVDQAAQEAAKAEVRQQRVAHHHAELEKALKAVRDEAVAGSDKRERTPRRSQVKAEVKEEAKDTKDASNPGGASKDGEPKDGHAIVEFPHSVHLEPDFVDERLVTYGWWDPRIEENARALDIANGHTV
ncbi:unnamed protein product, partial [Symbiodinium necroappetens]